MPEAWRIAAWIACGSCVVIAGVYVSYYLALGRPPSVRLVEAWNGRGSSAERRFREYLGIIAAVGAMGFYCCGAPVAQLVVGRGADPGVQVLTVALLCGLVASVAAIACVQRPELLVSARRLPSKPRRLGVPGVPAARIEVDPRGPGRTRVRIAAPAPLPMAGAARLRPPPGERLGRDTLNRMRWVGPGADPATRWTRALLPGINRALGVASRQRLAVTLTAHGILLQLPGLVPGDIDVAELRAASEMLHEALGQAAAEPPPDGISFTVASDLAGLCACCWEELSRTDRRVTCEHCGGAQHTDCFEWTGGCGRFACVGAAELSGDGA